MLRLFSFIGFLVISTSASAQTTYPNNLVHLVVPYPPGGISDIIARHVARHFEAHTGKTLIVDNKPGAGGNIGVDTVAKSKPDGYTICLIAAGNLVINPFLYDSMPFDAAKDVVPIAPIAEAPQVIVVSTSKVPSKSLSEFVQLAKQNPGKFSYGSGGVGTTNHLGGELFSQLAGVSMVHVPYRGIAPAVTGLVQGEIDFLTVGIAPLISQIQIGTVRPLATAADRRLPALPDVPTVKEAGINGFSLATWFGIIGPAGLDAGILARLNQIFSAMTSDPAFNETLRQQSLEPMNMTQGEFAQLIKSDSQRWSRVLKEAKITLQ